VQKKKEKNEVKFPKTSKSLNSSNAALSNLIAIRRMYVETATVSSFSYFYFINDEIDIDNEILLYLFSS